MKTNKKTKTGSMEELRRAQTEVKKLKTQLKKCEHAERDITARKRAEERIEHLNAVLTAIRNVNQIIVRERDPEKLVKRACEVLTKTRGYCTAWIALSDDSDKFSHIVSSGFHGAFKPLEECIQSGRLGKCALALGHKGVHVIHDPATECRDCPAARMYENQSAISIQLQHGRRGHGLMVLSMDARMVDDKEEQHLIAEVADDIAYSLQNLATEEKRIEAEKSRVETLARYQTLFEQSQDAILVSTPQGTIEDANSAGAAIFGLTSETVRSQNAADLYVNPADRQAVVQGLKLHGFMRNHAVTYRRADGSTFDALINTRTIPAPEGSGVQYLTTVRDITEVKRAQDALRESEARLSAVFNSSPVGISLTRLVDGQYVDVNDAFLRLFGYTREEALSHTSLQLQTWAFAKDRAGVVKMLREKRSVQNIEAPFRRTTGELWTGLFSAELIDIAGQPHILVLLQDISERNQERKALQASEERYRTTIMSVGDGVIATDTEGQVEMLNRVAAELTGRMQEEARGKPLEEVFRIVNEETRRTVENPVRRVVREGVVVGLANHTMLIAKDGTEHPIADSGAPIRNEKGEIAGVVLVFRDQTEERAAQKALRESEEKYRELFKNAQVGMYRSKLDGSALLAVNPKLCEIFGYSEEEMIGNPATIRWADPRARDRMVVELRQVGFLHDYEMDIVAKNGEIRTCSVSIQLHADKGYIEGSAVDITERKRAEEVIKDNEKRFRELIESLPQLFWTCRVDGPCDYLSKQWVEYTGVPEAEQLGYRWLEQLHPEDKDKIVSEWMEKVKTGESFDVEFRIRRNDNVYHWFKTRAVPMRDAEGRIVKWFGSNTDVDDLKQAENRLRSFNKELEKQVNERTNELQVSKHLLDESGRLARVGGWEIDLKKNELAWSDVVKQIHEVDPSYQPTLEAGIRFYAPEAMPVISEAVRAATEEGKSFDVELQLVTARQNRIWVRAVGQAYWDKGEIARVGGVFQDINERKLAEIELERYRDHLQELIKERTTELASSRELLVEAQTMAHLGSWTWDAVKDEITGSEEFYRLFGVRQEQIAHLQQFITLLHADDRERVQRDVADSLEQRKPYDTDYRVILPDDDVRHINARGQVFVDDSGKPLRMVGTCMDITERKLAAEELREREARYKTLVENIPQKIFMKDRNYRFVTVSENFARDLGVRPEEFVGKEDCDLFPKALADKYHADDVRIIETGKTENLEEKYVVAGKETWVNTIKTPVRDATGEIVGVLGVFWDITERKRAEEEIHMLNTELEQRVSQRTSQLEAANKELEAFTYSVSHDLRAPLRHASGYVELLSKRCQSNLPENGQHYLSSIADSVRRMGVLIDDLLQFSRTGRMEMRQRDIDMNGIVRETVESLRQDNPDRTIEWVLGVLPSVSGDDAMLRLVWMNLLSNAVKFTRTRKKARIEIGVRREAKEFVFFVHDDGVGFDMQYAQKLFGVFQRLHPTEEFEGTGIGLANVRRIILRHGGRTWAEGELDKGATFYFSIPIQ